MAELNRNQLSADGSTPPLTKEWVVDSDCVALRDDGRWYRAKIIDVGDNLYRVTPSLFTLGAFSTDLILRINSSKMSKMKLLAISRNIFFH